MLKKPASIVLGSIEILNVPAEGTPPVSIRPAALLDGLFEHPAGAVGRMGEHRFLRE